MEFVAANDLVPADDLAYLIKYDSVHRRAPYPVEATPDSLRLGERVIKAFAQKDPAQLPWKDLGVDVVIESTGFFTKRDLAAKHLAGERVEVFSAGSEPAAAVHPLAVRAMAEIGVDISAHHPKPLTDLLGQPFDYVIAVCSRAAQTCPVFPGPARRLHWFYDDPAAVEGSEAERLAAFRAVRDDLRRRIVDWLADGRHPDGCAHRVLVEP